MPPAPIDGLARIPDSLCAALRRRLVDAGYDRSTILAAEQVAPGVLDLLRLPLVHLRLAQRNTPAAQLARLFAYEDRVPADVVRRLLGDDAFDALRDFEVLDDGAGSDGVRSRFCILPVGDLFFLSDSLTAGSDAVMGPGAMTTLLFRTLPEQIAGSLLDVGSGAGTLALVGARRGASPAVGVDINPRAIAIARFNARFNHLEAEFLEGDLLAPVRGRAFDWMVAQPPFVAHPADVPSVTYLHGGQVGDELLLRMLAQIPASLAPGGRAMVTLEAPVWERERAPTLQDRLRAAVGAAPVDVLVLQAPAGPSELQALAYAFVQSPELSPAFTAAAVGYARHLDGLGIARFLHALVVLDRRESADGRRYTVTLSVPDPGRLCARDVGDTLAALELAVADDGTLGAARLRIAPGARFLEERARPDREIEPTLRIQVPSGRVAATAEFSESAFALLRIVDGAPSVDEAIAAGAAANDVPPDALRAEILSFVRDSLLEGLLVAG